MDKTCVKCDAMFEITKDELDIIDTISPEFNGKKYSIPPPTHCPVCRSQRRLAFRHERGLHRRTCDHSGKSMVTTYSPDKPFTIYHSDAWWGDDWNGLDYGRDYDFSRPFFDQINDLWHEVPLIGLWLIESENSDYNTNCFQLKDCYMCANSDFGQNYIYGYCVERSKDVTDCAFLHECEVCYECVDCWQSYNCKFSQDLRNCSDCMFSSELTGCKYCFGCHGLRQKKYCIYNEEVGEVKWNKHMQDQLETWDAIEEAKQTSRKLSLQIPKPALHMINCEDSVGDHLYNCRDVQDCFDVRDGERMRYGAYNVMRSQHLIDSYAAGGIQWAYEYMGGGVSVSTVAFILNCANGLSDSYYCILGVNGSHHLFGCVSPKKQSYCILNKQYSEDQYNDLVPKIIEHMRSTGEWGEYFPSSISPYGYNEVLAQEKYPLAKEQALQEGFRWTDIPEKETHAERTIPAEKLPERIERIPDDVLNWAIVCKETGNPFKIQKQELNFYRSQNLPLPRIHPDRRHENRIALRNPQKLYSRTCQKCQKAIQTTYSPDRPETVYCEKCYLETVY